MKNLILTISILTTSFGLSAQTVVPENNFLDSFLRTSSNYPWDTPDFDEVCQQEFGNDFLIADWNNVVAFVDENGFEEFFNQTGMTYYQSNGWVTRDGQHLYSSNRHYFIERHDGNVPGGWLVHASIGSNTIDLGSWHNSRPILCYNSNTTDITEIASQNLLTIGPNPFSNKTTIEFPNPNHSNYKLSVFSISGNKVFEMDNIKSDKIEFERGNLPEGIYLIELKGEKVFRGKMVVK
ncbi:MAG: T9SS type A sorting domain-containing protein [Bacteroidetes bacterium]|nr:T9SS type A sorting domain-containing protein [Bacteroidota bacterium]MBL7102887.1 T9SS type A sorting domain-containing protein [Bacteroidales bacterium]